MKYTVVCAPWNNSSDSNVDNEPVGIREIKFNIPMGNSVILLKERLIPGYKWLTFRWVNTMISVCGIPWDDIPDDRKRAGDSKHFVCLMVRESVLPEEFEIHVID